MMVFGKSADARVSSVRLGPTSCLVFVVAAAILAMHVLIGHVPFCTVFHRLQTPSRAMPTPRTCQAGTVAVDAAGNPCISLKNLTLRTFIHRAVAPDATYMYCSIPKNGCSYHIDLLHRVNGDLFQGNLKHMTENKGKIILSDGAEAARLLANSSVPKYMVIRNPMTRTLSGYLCKVERYLPEIEKTPATFQKWARKQLIGLKSWHAINSHWKAQTEFCGYNLRDVQKRFQVFRVEKPQEYVDFIYEHLPGRVLDQGWGLDQNFRDFVLGPRKRTSNTEKKFFEYVDNLETFDLIERTYRKDIDVLGYRAEVTVMRETLIDLIAKTQGRKAIDVEI